MSQNDTVEAMGNGDCMCICLQISRSEATIQDPSKLIVHDIVPTFMSCDSFLESSIFNLKKSEDASGGFDYTKQGNLALGVGRESVSGAMPLFLFNEHWQIASKKIQSLFGFLCTLDPLGYASSQYFTIPFLVLDKAIEKQQTAPSEVNQRVLDLIMETCQQIVANNDNMKKQIVSQFNAFAIDPASRTADVINSVEVLTTQAYVYQSLTDE